jgi:hypothetical protein
MPASPRTHSSVAFKQLAINFLSAVVLAAIVAFWV